MATSVKDQPQLALDEQQLDDQALEDALEKRWQRSNAAKAARKALTEAHEKVLALVSEHDLADGDALRVGRFRITKRAIQGRSVAFETADSSRITISVIGD